MGKIGGCCSEIQCPYQVIVNPVALRKAKIVYNFGLYECSRVKLVMKI